MLTEMVKHIAQTTGLQQKTARVALGIVLNAAERQGAGFAADIYERIPGARTLAADMGARTGAATGVVARLIEQTPGGRQFVLHDMIRNLHKEGLGTREIGALIPAVTSFSDSAAGVDLLQGAAEVDVRRASNAA